MHEENELLLATLHIPFLIPKPKNKTLRKKILSQNTVRNSKKTVYYPACSFTKKNKRQSQYIVSPCEHTRVYSVGMSAEVGRRLEGWMLQI